jgi:hypothetical protein
VKLHVNGAAVDPRGAQLDQLEQLFVDTRLRCDLAERCDDIVSIGRDLPEVFILAACMGHLHHPVLSVI